MCSFVFFCGLCERAHGNEKEPEPESQRQKPPCEVCHQFKVFVGSTHTPTAIHSHKHTHTVSDTEYG